MKVKIIAISKFFERHFSVARFLKLIIIKNSMRTTHKILKTKKYQINRFNLRDRRSKSKETKRAILILTKMDDRNLTKGIKPISVLEIKRLDLIESLNNGTYKVDTRELCNMTASLASQRKWGDKLSKIAKDSGLLKKD